MKDLLSYLWKLPLCAFGFMLGLIASGSVLPALGIEPPALPAGADANTILLWHLLGSVLMALALGALSRWLPAGFAFRWLALSALAWSVSALSTVLEASIFMSTGATASPGSLAFTAASYLLPCVALAGAAAWLFPPAAQAEAGWRRAGRWWVSRPAQAWGVRLAAAWAAFPVIYVACGWLVQPFIVGYYAGGQFELAAPPGPKSCPCNWRAAYCSCWPACRLSRLGAHRSAVWP
ncbi:MAG: hypothetical protein IT318_09150 [Anaerolineales bacterium]|nr:hypothetical protein [Anaerolineales bacterium]